MAARIIERMTPDGIRFQRMLKELADKEVRIGFEHGKDTEENGTDICDVAAWNELGTENMPSRPFLRKSIDENENTINAFLQSKKRELIEGASAEQVLKEIGIFQKDLIQEKITEGNFLANAESTRRQKGSSKPLIDSGRMRQSVNYVIQKKGSRDG